MLQRNPARILTLVGLVLLTSSEVACSQQRADLQPVTLRVLVPQANAKLKIQGQETTQSGTDRLFVSPPLDPNKKYIYKIVTIWEPNNYTKITRTRNVTVKAGDKIDIDMTKADPKQPDDILVRYVPTPQEIVDEMCKLARIGKDDVVVDLGCGDGRLVITAVEKFGAKSGLGIDIDPARIKECLENAKKSKVKDKVAFREANVLQLQEKDIEGTTVMLLYLGNDLNQAIRPLIRKVLKPGARLVSHRFTMGDWKPDKSIVVTDKRGEQYRLHLWNIKDEAAGNGEEK